MKTRSVLRRSVVAFFILLTLAAFPIAASANHSWGGYHWARTSNPFTLKLGDNVSSTWDPILATTSSDWTQSTVLNTTIVAGQAKPRNCRPTAGRVEVCSSTYGSNGWLGVAQIWVSSLHITQGTVKLNDTYMNSSPYNTTAWHNLVSCQEVGHTLGLAHQDENFNNPNLGTCMDYTNSPGTNQHPNQHDYDELVTIYSHLDSTNTVFMPAGVANGDFGARDQWGELARTSPDGGVSLYVRDFGQGNLLLTRVIWATEASR